MQSTGHTSTQERSLMSMQGSAMMYVTAGLLYRRNQLLDEVPGPLVQGRFDDDLGQSGRLRRPQPGGGAGGGPPPRGPRKGAHPPPAGSSPSPERVNGCQTTLKSAGSRT